MLVSIAYRTKLNTFVPTPVGTKSNHLMPSIMSGCIETYLKLNLSLITYWRYDLHQYVTVETARCVVWSIYICLRNFPSMCVIGLYC